MDPFTMMFLSTMVSGGSKLMAGQAESDAYNEQAREARRLGAEKSRVAGLEGRRVVGSQRAGFGAAGVELEGSPMLVMMESIGETMREQESIIAGAKSEEKTLRKKAKQSRMAGYMGAAESLFTLGANS